MSINKAVLCGLVVAVSTLSGGLQAADGLQSKGVSSYTVVSAGKPANTASMIGVHKPEQRMNAEDLEWWLHECVRDPQGMTVSDCIASLDGSEP